MYNSRTELYINYFFFYFRIVFPGQNSNFSKFGRLNQSLKIFEKYKRKSVKIDYLVFGTVLAISAIIGIFFGFRDRKKSAEEFLMGGGDVAPIPVAMSLATTFFSAITILSTPVEYYNYGTMYTYYLVMTPFFSRVSKLFLKTIDEIVF